MDAYFMLKYGWNRCIILLGQSGRWKIKMIIDECGLIREEGDKNE